MMAVVYDEFEGVQPKDESTTWAPDSLEEPEIEGPPTREEWLADFRARARAADNDRWRRELAGEIEPEDPSPVSRPVAPYDPLEEVIAQFTSKEWIERRRREDAAHAASCTATFCDRCSRFACERCHSVRVGECSAVCVDCRVRAAVEAACIPPRYADAFGATARRVRSKSARKLASESIDARAVALLGPAGAGKSTLAAAMLVMHARRAIEAGRRPESMLWTSAIALGRARAEHRLGDGEAELVLNAMEVDLLVLDDLGAEAARDADAIAAVIHRRHDDDLATWITTGFGATEIGARYGAGLERRIFEGATVIDCGVTK